MRGDRFFLCADQHPYRRCCGDGRWLVAYGTGDSAVPGRIFFNTFYRNDLTACVMPLILLVLMGLIYLSFFVHNRAWLTAAAYESAVSGSMEGIKKNGEIYDTARMRSEELGSIGFFGAENLGTQTNVGKEVQVTYDLDTISSYGNLSWHLRTEGKSAVINPVKHIRRLRAAQAVLREMGE